MTKACQAGQTRGFYDCFSLYMKSVAAGASLAARRVCPGLEPGGHEVHKPKT